MTYISAYFKLNCTKDLVPSLKTGTRSSTRQTWQSAVTHPRSSVTSQSYAAVIYLPSILAGDLSVTTLVPGFLAWWKECQPQGVGWRLKGGHTAS
jgi:hypothetical protein